MQELATTLATPNKLVPATGDNALYQHGMAVGANLILQFLFRFDEMAIAVKVTNAAAALVADYGADAVQKESEA